MLLSCQCLSEASKFTNPVSTPCPNVVAGDILVEPQTSKEHKLLLLLSAVFIPPFGMLQVTA